MKFSQFNSTIPYQGKYALYNSFSQRVVFLEKKLLKLLQSIKENNLKELLDVHPQLFDVLTVNGFIVSKNLDEIDAVRSLAMDVDNNSRKFWLIVNPTMNCNFKCWYCYETHVKSSRITKPMIDKVNKLITNLTDSKSLKFINVSFFGGEPLLYFSKDVIPVMDHLQTECENKKIRYHINFTTNGLLINANFIKYFVDKNITSSVQITLDGYKNDHDNVRFVKNKLGSYDTIIRNVRLLITNRFFVRLRVNYTDKNIKNCWRIAEEFLDIPDTVKQKHLVVDFHRVWQNNAGDIDEILNENIRYIRNRGILVSSKFSPNNVRDSCYADKRNNATINYNGDVFKCTARDFTTAKREGYLDDDGKIVWETNLDLRMQSKFKNPPCFHCRIMPLCNGGCTQHALENGNNEYCIYGGYEDEINKVVSAKIDEIVSTPNCN